MSDKNHQATIEDVLDAVNNFASVTEGKFAEIKSEMTDMKSEMTDMKSEMTDMKSEMTDMKSEMKEMRFDITKMGSTMVTKDYLDDKMADLRGDLVVLTRKEDTKLRALVDILKEKSVLNIEEAKKILGMEPFAQLPI